MHLFDLFSNMKTQDSSFKKLSVPMKCITWHVRLLVADFLLDMQPLMLLNDNVHICSSKGHELNFGHLIHLSHNNSSLCSRNPRSVLTRKIIGKILRDCPHDGVQVINGLCII